jgi:hypothetical protein
MKALAMITLATMMATTAPAQSYFGNVHAHPTSDLTTAAARYMESFRIDNEGVIGSALAHAVWIKLMRPEMEFADLEAKVNALVLTAPTVALRSRARLAGLVFDSPEMFTGISSMEFAGDAELFAAVAGRVSYSSLEKKEK